MSKVTLLISVIVFTVAVGLKAETETETATAMPTEMPLSLESSTEEEEEEDQVENSESLGDISYEQYSDYPVRVLKETDVAILTDKCHEGECRGFIYDDPSEMVFFEAKPAVRFTSGSTYVFKKAPEFEVLKFVDSKFANFPLNLFYAVTIHELDMRNCSIQSLSWDNFLMADKLTILLLSGNDFQEIKPMTFNSAENLAFLFLDSNDIDTLHRESFKELNKLYLLDLHDNRLDSLPDDVFSYLPALQQLNLAGNRLRVISDVIFLNNPRLTSVSLQGNVIEELGDYVFQNQEEMDYIDLSHNAPLQSLVGNMQVDNLWARNCSLSRVNIYGKAKNVDFQKNHIVELYFSRPENLETLRLNDNNLQQIASISQATNLQYFDISNNPQLKALPEMWQADSLENLDLSNTSLTTVPVAMLSSSENLKSLNVSNNLLTHIDPGTFKYFEKLNQLYIHRNNWNCYSLQIIMDMLIKPWKISYTMDAYDEAFPGEYIEGIKCMYRLDAEEEDEMENSLIEPFMMNGLASRVSEGINADNMSGQSSQLYQVDSSEDESDLDILRREFKTIVGIYEQKFDTFLRKIDDLDRRLKSFEQFNQTLWQQVTIAL